jgi:hypothetical protein
MNAIWLSGDSHGNRREKWKSETGNNNQVNDGTLPFPLYPFSYRVLKS